MEETVQRFGSLDYLVNCKSPMDIYVYVHVSVSDRVVGRYRGYGDRRLPYKTAKGNLFSISTLLNRQVNRYIGNDLKPLWFIVLHVHYLSLLELLLCQ